MKTKKLGLNVDSIGGHGHLTQAEEKAISDFIRQRKLLSKKPKKKQQSKAS